MKKTTDSIQKALEDIRNGKIVMVIDDPDRENEGDFICAAEFATPENVNFMATHGKGINLYAYEQCPLQTAWIEADGRAKYG